MVIGSLMFISLFICMKFKIASARNPLTCSSLCAGRTCLDSTENTIVCVDYIASQSAGILLGLTNLSIL